MNKAKRFRLHFFNDLVAIRLGDGETCYMEPALARSLSQKLDQATKELDQKKHFNTIEVDEKEVT